MVSPGLTLLLTAALQLQGLIARPLGGEPTSFESLVSKEGATVVVFATVWCRVCVSELPELDRWSKAHPEVPVLYVLSGTKADRTQLHCDEFGIRSPTVLVDAEGEIADRFGVDGTPTLFLMEPEIRGPYHRVRALPEPKRPPPPSTPAVGRLKHFVDEGAELGTRYTVAVAAPATRAAQVAEDLRVVRSMTRVLEARLSEWKTDSEISILNARGADGPVPLSQSLAAIIDGALGVSRATGGAFDITWRPLDVLWARAEARDRLPTRSELQAVLQRVGHQHIVRSDLGLAFDQPGVVLGIAGVAKGWIIDRVFLELERRGYTHILVNIGGDIRVRGPLADGSPRVLELADPFAPDETAARLSVDVAAVATSGNYFRTRSIQGRSVGHIVDPRTGWPPDFEGSVTVLTRDAAMADALATGLFVMGPEAGLDFASRTPGVEVVYVTRGAIYSTLSRVEPLGRPLNP